MRYDENVSRLRYSYFNYYKEGDLISSILTGERLIGYLTLTGNNEGEEYSTDLYNLGCIYDEISYYERAIDLYSESLEIIKNIYGENLIFADRLCNLAASYSKSGDNDAAFDYHEKVYNIRAEQLDNNHIDYVHSVYNLANACVDCNKYDEAIKYHQKALKGSKNNNLDYSDVLNSLAYIYEEKEDFESAIKYCKKAITYIKKELGESHEEFIKNTYYLAMLYEENKEYDKAIRLYNKSASYLKERLSENHPYFATVLNDLSDAYCKKGNINKGLKIKLLILDLMKKTIGEYHINYVASLKNISELYKKSGDIKKSAEIYKRSIAITKILYGEHSRQYIDDFLTLCDMYVDNNCTEDAAKLILSAIEVKEGQSEDYKEYIKELTNVYKDLCEKSEEFDFIKDVFKSDGTENKE